MKILTLMDYDRLEKINVRDLQQLINEGRITAFRRASGWVNVGSDPIRGSGGEQYLVPERREFKQNLSRQDEKGISVCTLTHDDWA